MISVICLIALILLDRITKVLADIYLKPIPTFPIIEDVLHLTYVENTGAAFGMLKDNRWVFMLTSTVVIIAIAAYLYINHKRTDKFITFTLCMILAGGIGNMIDRICMGYVIDFVDFRLIDFAVFNVADSALTIGAVLLAVYVLFIEQKKAKLQSNGKDSVKNPAKNEEKQGE